MINKTIITIPPGIKYISEWKEYSLPGGHCIVDKGVTGCGYTELGLRGDNNVILCSPRKILLENKAEQHQEDENILYLENNLESFSDLGGLQVKIDSHIAHCAFLRKPVKFMITYDSAHYLVDYLWEKGKLDDYYLIADEFQSIFLDSYFKAEVENEFLENIQKCPNIIYLSATPMLDKYLVKLQEFANLPFYEMDWSKSGYVESIRLQRRRVSSLTVEAEKIVREYLSGIYPTIVTPKGEVFKSTEAVFYFNSVTEIIRVVNKCGLSQDQVNIICSKTDENKRKLRKAGHVIGKIPTRNEPNKMFTFCTSTCYIGSDFYSKCASTYIFADPNLRWLALDISLDLPQIAGRQRDRDNLFKNNITIFYKTLSDSNKLNDKQAFEDLQQERREESQRVLNIYNNLVDPKEKRSYMLSLRARIMQYEYENDFISVSRVSQSPKYNNLIEIANDRAWEVSQEDYQDSISVTKAMENLDFVQEVGEYKDYKENIVQDFLDNYFYSTGIFAKKMELFCRFMDEYKDDVYIANLIHYKIPDPKFNNFYTLFGTSGCKAAEFKESILSRKLEDIFNGGTIRSRIVSRFSEGSRYTLRDIKTLLSNIYEELGVSRTPKATDMEEWFEVKRIKLIDPLTKNWENGFELLKKKETF